MLEQFFADLLPREGHFALWTKRTKQHLWVDSHEALVRACDAAADIEDTYYATAAFGDDLSPATGELARKQTNVLSRKCLHADLDCGEVKYAKDPENAYPTQRDALVAIRDFEHTTGLQFTHILTSGQGIHAYIALDQELSHLAWVRLAKVFQAFAKQFNLKLDSSCTTDSARVLRAPGALHSCGKRVALKVRREHASDPTELLQRMSSQLVVPVAPPKAAKARKSINGDVLSVEGPPKSVRNIVQKCGALAQVVRAKGDVPEPLWRAMLGLVKFTVEGDTAAHALSKGHPKYSHADTQEKLDRWTAGPSTCAEFAKHCSACGSCAHQGKIKSPAVLGYMTAPQVEELPIAQQPAATKPPAATGDAWDGSIPPGFKVVKKGDHPMLVWSMPVERDDEDGNGVTVYVDVPVTNEIFWFGQWADAEHSDDVAQTVMHKWDGGAVCTYTFDQTLLGNQSKFREFLAGKAILSASHKQSVKAMEEYAKAQHQRIKALGRKPKINSRFGLRVTHDGSLIAAQGGYVIYPNGEIREAMLGPELRALGTKFCLPVPPSPDGVWAPEVFDTHITPAATRHVEFLRQQYSAPGLGKFRLAAMMALASPLQAFVTGEYTSGMALPPCGLTVSMYSSKGGRGKTTLMRAAALAFGKPGATTRDSNELGTTEKGRIARLSLMGTLPVGMDEMGDNTAKSVASLISAIANGTSREGAQTNGGLRTGTTWSLMCIIGTNKSQRDMIAAAQSESDAIQYRLLELDVDGLPEFGHEERASFDRRWSAIADTAGALGAVIHRSICRMGVKGVNELVLRCVAKASELVGADQTARFQYRGLGAVIALHQLLKAVGLQVFDISDLVQEFKAAHDEGKAFVTDNIMPSDELELFSIFLNDMQECTAVTRGMTRRNLVDRSYDTVLGAEPKTLKVRHVIDTRMSYVTGDALRDWAQAKHIPQAKLIRAAIGAGVIERPVGGTEQRVKVLRNLRQGMVDSTNSKVRCFVVNVGRLSQLIGKGYEPPGVGDGDNVVSIQDAA